VISVWHILLESCASEQSCVFGTTPRRIALILEESIDDIESVLFALEDIGLIKDGRITKWESRQFVSDNSTERVQRFRERTRNVSETSDETNRNAPEQSRTEQNIEDQREKKPAKTKHGEYKHVMLTAEQHAKLIEDFGADQTAKMIRRLDEYIQMKGASYKDHNLTMRNWVNKDAEKSRPSSPSSALRFVTEADL